MCWFLRFVLNLSLCPDPVLIFWIFIGKWLQILKNWSKIFKIFLLRRIFFYSIQKNFIPFKKILFHSKFFSWGAYSFIPFNFVKFRIQSKIMPKIFARVFGARIYYFHLLIASLLTSSSSEFFSLETITFVQLYKVETFFNAKHLL